ncbi:MULTISPECIES: LysR family transcriptional regulator [Acinetobacter]|uniref:LysR family transcriptional regulator n=1 Tax=Acinetobacter oleivorans TaxID=1148157 RepID=A0A0B2UEY9_9GAMM|nr:MULTISPECIES: LysR family transcriptional regulator [Acinetobacter]KHN67784.1 LysR family transcriptional regulator [Acinetobacter oleivorans]KUM12252.1 LysR family transcriptional regulator [Acinetobacter calcoaceticus]MCU4422843.1 LysR family transcriptional regulator [Acinetobacter sp. WU_MDCI_Abxb74]MEB3862631.1 LysR family transcriptional regulator [Acinetobacter sp. IK31]
MRKNLDGGLLHAMHAFLKVIDSGSFTAAAEQMDLTTAQVSRLISELETRLGTKLIQRSTRQQALTDIGAAYAERCRQVISMVDEAESEVAGTASKPKGRLRVLSMGSFGHHYVFPVMAEFCKNYPELTVEYTTSQYVPDLLAKGVDVSLYLTESLTDSRFVARRIGTIFSVLCASPAYLEKHGKPESPEDLKNHACLRLVNPSITADWHLLNAKGESYQIDIGGQLIADNPELLLDVVQQDMGVALLPMFSALEAVQNGRLCHILPEWRSPDIGVYTLLPSRHFIDAKTRAWLDWVEEYISPRIEMDASYFYK